ncbi:MAG: coenzyme F420-0:L-glutamate ligase [Anaerolineae bacterium]|nr:coenzyme F420-0:L-glutamate ligase [Anaerolineae bacterium]MDW8071483.1 coenzyme F420-0:L-glutamate ligase [Anaerolineae bacterium]
MLSLIPLTGIPIVQPGDDLGQLIVQALARTDGGITLHDEDILVVTQKVVSRAEGRFVALRSVQPSPQACELAARTGKDARLVEVMLWDTAEVVRVAPRVILVRHRLGFVCANAGVDASNVAEPEAEMVLRLPADPDRSAQQLRARIRELTGAAPAIVISDSHGRPWREGIVGVAIGIAGLQPVQDLRGVPDLFGRPLQITTVGFADQIAAAASLVSGQAHEGLPVVLVRGLSYQRDETASARALLRPPESDLFR